MGPRIQVCFLQNICKNMIIICTVIKAELTSKQEIQHIQKTLDKIWLSKHRLHKAHNLFNLKSREINHRLNSSNHNFPTAKNRYC
jgi:hypothetical protein